MCVCVINSFKLIDYRECYMEQMSHNLVIVHKCDSPHCLHLFTLYNETGIIILPKQILL
uniref:Uncharacterized protein n=1 Tax=Anguilla anguilla TaxID=7936 RepID=A0A0E9W4A3_ANGAN